MPILDWTRSNLNYVLPDGSDVLCYNHTEVAAFDLFALKRPGAEEEYDEDDYEAAEEGAEDEAGEDVAVTPRSKSIWQHITTGSFFTSGAVQYYRYLIAIAVMYFISIFLTFVSLNADREYRKLDPNADRNKKKYGSR